MRMGEQDGADRFGIEPQMTVPPNRFVSAPLKHAAIEQQPESRCLQQMPAPCHRARRAIEGKFHMVPTPL